MDKVRSNWDQYIYLVSEDTTLDKTLGVSANVGSEIMRYLSLLIDRYNSLLDIFGMPPVQCELEDQYLCNIYTSPLDTDCPSRRFSRAVALDTIYARPSTRVSAIFRCSSLHSERSPGGMA